jgi:hypothetical protein
MIERVKAEDKKIVDRKSKGEELKNQIDLNPANNEA